MVLGRYLIVGYLDPWGKGGREGLEKRPFQEVGGPFHFSGVLGQPLIF